MAGMVFCRACGKEIHESALACPHCGATQLGGGSPKSRAAAAILCFLFGVFGVHRFYVGKIGTGILELITLGGLGFWALIDFIVIVCGAFRDKDNKPLIRW
jgi:hypothetical protein